MHFKDVSKKQTIASASLNIVNNNITTVYIKLQHYHGQATVL